MSSAAATLPDAAVAPDRRGSVVLVAGGPTSFLRVAAVAAALREAGQEALVIHSGRRHAGPSVTDALAHAGASTADLWLEVDSRTPGARTGSVLVEMQRVLREVAPAVVVVAGGLDSTLGCALAAARQGVHVVHLEAGLRSFEWSTADEINRTLIDRLARTLLVSHPAAADNLAAEGVPTRAVHHVGSTLVDVVRACESPARALRAWEQIGVDAGTYVLVSLHRPEHVDSPTRLHAIAGALTELAPRHPVVLSLDASTHERLRGAGSLDRLLAAGVQPIARVDYLQFLSLMAGSGAVLTDAGAIQEETSALGVPCFTLRRATDRPLTLDLGTNTLVGDDEPVDLRMVAPGLADRCAVPLWDGAAAGRAAAIVSTVAATEVAARA
jgi:UDP-N-acetylglucosamine 2-epimerase (non-hydrolysing)